MQGHNNKNITGIHECINELVFKIKEHIISKDLNNKLKGTSTSPEPFKHKTEELALAHILKGFPDSRVGASGLGMLNESLENCSYTFIVNCLCEPVNALGRAPFYGLAVAVLPGRKLGCSSVVYALLADLTGDVQISAARGLGILDAPGAAQDSMHLHSSLVACNLDAVRPEVLALVGKVILAHSCVRWFGSAVLSLLYLVQGRFSAYYDVRGLAKADHFLAASLLLEETGGMLTDATGQPLDNIPDLNHNYNFVASAKKEDHKSFLAILQ